MQSLWESFSLRRGGSVRARPRRGCLDRFRLARQESMRHGLCTVTLLVALALLRLKGGTRPPGTLSTARPGGAKRTSARAWQLIVFCVVQPGRSTTRIDPNPRRTGQGVSPGPRAFRTCLHHGRPVKCMREAVAGAVVDKNGKWWPPPGWANGVLPAGVAVWDGKLSRRDVEAFEGTLAEVGAENGCAWAP